MQQIQRFFGRVKKGSPIDIAILVCAAALIIALLAILVMSLLPDAAPVDASSSAPSSSSVSASQSGSYDPDADALDKQAYDGTILPETADGGQTYIDETMFLGDSNTYRLVAYGLTTWQNNLSAVGMGIQHVTSTPCMYFKGSSSPVYVAKAVSMMQPRRIVITYGTNNTNSTADTFKNQYRSALEAIKKEWPYADIIINAVPPVAQTRTGAAAAQKAIDEFNKALADLAKEDGYRFLNSSEALKDPATGFARASYMIEDGLHLNEQGAKALIDYVRTHTYETEDRRPALTTIPTHTATPEETFNPQAASSSSSSSSSEAEGVTVTFSIKDGKDGGSLSGTLTQKVKPGETCSTVTATAKEGYSLEWGCTEGRIENVNNGTLTFTVPANTKLESISVWVTFKNKHTHSFGSWTDAGNGTHTRTCTASGCTNPPKTETENHIKGNWTADPSDATKMHIYCTQPTCHAILDTHTHSWSGWTDAGDGVNHKRTCSVAGCPAPTETQAHSWGATDQATGPRRPPNMSMPGAAGRMRVTARITSAPAPPPGALHPRNCSPILGGRRIQARAPAAVQSAVPVDRTQTGLLPQLPLSPPLPHSFSPPALFVAGGFHFFYQAERRFFMLNSKGFDEWAAGYDASVRHSHDAGEYPFAGYDAVLSLIEARVNSRPGADVLDLGFGTGMLTARLYAAGHPVAGVDFSQNMLDAARAKMPCAELYLYDFTRGLPPALEGRTFDFIISTYAFHHVPDAGKPAFLLELSRRLSPGGECLIGDVAFETQAELDACHAAAGTAWDCGEDYAVAQLLAGALPSLRLSFARLSHCAGVLSIGRHDSPQPV